MGVIKTIETKGKRFLVRVFTWIVRTPSVTRDELLATPPRRILVIRQHNQMGDMLLAVPALRAIKESIPGVEVTILTGQINRDVMLNNPYVDRVLTYNPRNPLSWSAMVRGMRQPRNDMVIVLHTVSFSFTSAMLGLMSGSRWRVGSTSAPFGNRMSDAFYHFELPLPSERALDAMNEAEHNLYPLGAMGIRTDNIAPLLVPTQEEREWADEFVTRNAEPATVRLAVHPGAGKVENIWPPERFAEVVNLLADRIPLSLIVIEGPRDAEPVARFCRLASPQYTVLRGRAIGDVAAVVQTCDLVLCNDTGVMHVASAAGARTLAVFGPTDPLRWAPRCQNLHIVRGENGNLAEVTSREVLERALSILSGDRRV
jgi:heptosyltransferase-2